MPTCALWSECDGECLPGKAGDVDAVRQATGEHSAARDTGAEHGGSAGVADGEVGRLPGLIGNVPGTGSHASAVFFFFADARL